VKGLLPTFSAESCCRVTSVKRLTENVLGPTELAALQDRCRPMPISFQKPEVFKSQRLTVGWPSHRQHRLEGGCHAMLSISLRCTEMPSRNWEGTLCKNRSLLAVGPRFFPSRCLQIAIVAFHTDKRFRIQ
jgi:hypothetical protein